MKCKDPSTPQQQRGRSEQTLFSLTEQLGSSREGRRSTPPREARVGSERVAVESRI